MGRNVTVWAAVFVIAIVLMIGCRTISSPGGGVAEEPARVEEGAGPAKSVAYKDTRVPTGTGYGNVTRPAEPAYAYTAATAPVKPAAGAVAQPVVRAMAQPVAGAAAPVDKRGLYQKPGFDTVMKDGRLWVFEEGGAELFDFLAGNEPAKHVTMVKAGPGAVTLKGRDRDLLLGYLAARKGFYTKVVDGRIWVFRPGTEPLRRFESAGEPAKHVTRPASGPQRATVRGPDRETVVEYLTAKEGFETRFVDDRLWVFRAGSEDQRAFDAGEEPVKLVVRPSAGPFGLTLKAVDMEAIKAYMAAAEGFATEIVDDRIWVFRSGSADYENFRSGNEPVKIVVRPSAGPLKMTVKSTEQDIISAYLYQVSR